jgi:hypothetical protein
MAPPFGLVFSGSRRRAVLQAAAWLIDVLERISPTL